jgi:hypothetical protein
MYMKLLCKYVSKPCRNILSVTRRIGWEKLPQLLQIHFKLCQCAPAIVHDGEVAVHALQPRFHVL